MPAIGNDRLDARDLRAISAHAVTRSFAKHTVVVSEGDASNSLYVVLEGRVRTLTGNVKSLALMDVYGRVARVLLDLAREERGELVIENKPTQRELAERIGASCEMVSRILKELAAGGYLRIDARRIIIAKNLPQRW